MPFGFLFTATVTEVHLLTDGKTWFLKNKADIIIADGHNINLWYLYISWDIHVVSCEG